MVIHSDGSLDPGWVSILRHHIPGCTVVSPEEAESRAAQALGRDSYLFQCRKMDINYRRLIDTELWSGRKKKIIMDADILVLRHPEEVINWVRHGDAPVLMGQPPRSPHQSILDGGDGNHVQTIFKKNLPKISEAMGLPHVFLDGTTGGFYGSSGQITLQSIEFLIKISSELGIPLQRWGSDQCLIIYLLSAAGAHRLDQELYRNFLPEDAATLDRRVLLHFFGTHRFYKQIYTNLAAGVVAQLPKAPTQPLGEARPKMVSGHE